MGKLNIAFDLDGTFVDIHSQFAPILKEMTGKDVSNPTQFGITEEFDISEEILWKAIEEAYYDWNNTPIFPGVRELVAALHKKSGDALYFVTARPKRYATETFKLIQKFCPYPFKVAMCDSSEEKSKYLENYLFYADDRRRTAFHLANEGKVVYMPIKTYNMPSPFHHSVIPIKMIDDLLKLTDLFIKGDS